MMQRVEQAKHAADALSLGVVVGTVAEWLPAVASIMSIVWMLIRIWETKTVQRLVRRKK